MLQNASKTDTRRLNLEYIDIIIDYILNALQQPWISDDTVDMGNLNIEREKVLKVGFNPSETVIPESSVRSEMSESVREEEREGEGERSVGESENETQNQENADREENTITQSDNITGDNPTVGGVSLISTTPPSDAASCVSSLHLDHTPSVSSTNFLSIPPRHKSSTRSLNTGSTVSGSSNSRSVRSYSRTTSHDSSRLSIDTNTSAASSSSRLAREGVAGGKVGREAVTESSGESQIRPRGELSRLLVENIPREILKRMVIRWPVGDEPTVVSRAELNRKRLMITLWDVSGDPLQHNFTPFFFSHRCLFVCMYNLTRELDAPCESYVAKDLCDADGRAPTNAEALEEWLGYVSAFCQPLPSVPFRCSHSTPVLPPVILACSFADEESVRANPVNFHSFFGRPSLGSYNKHLVESSKPGALKISSYSENEGEEDYAGHHLLRREIDHLARQMPFCCDNVPIQWVKFEQLIYGLQEQKKIVILYDDLTRFVAEHCQVLGTLQVLPILSHFHDIGVISYFYRHPLLSNIVITKPQWLADALSAVIVVSPSKWVTTEVQVAFTRLRQEGIITKEMLLLSYRCGRMHQRYWSETLFILNAMDLICCHPVCHESNSLYVPCLVAQPSPRVSAVIGNSTSRSLSLPTTLHFSSGTAAFPIATFNQFVVRSIRSCRYPPKLFYCSAHLKLGPNHHLIVSKHRTSISICIHTDHKRFCPSCSTEYDNYYPPSPECSHIRHITGGEGEHFQSDNIASLIEISTKLRPIGEPSLPFGEESLDQICPSVLKFVRHNLNFLTNCWFPGLKLELIANLDRGRVVLDRHWRHDVLEAGIAPPSLSVWFD